MRIIFLDLDGVLNSFSWYHARPHPGLHFDPTLVERLNALVDATDARVVISSSWRIGHDVPYLTGVLDAYDFHSLAPDGAPRVVGMTPRPGSFEVSQDHWKEGRYPYERGHEIQAWLDENQDVCPVESFVILDDVSDMVYLAPRLVHVDGSAGLSWENVEQAMTILECPYVRNQLEPGRVPARLARLP